MAKNELLVLAMVGIVSIVALVTLFIISSASVKTDTAYLGASSLADSALTGAAAGKPADVIAWSNGFPSGEHYNLNIHGKKSDFACNPVPGGGSVFVPEYGQSEIQYIQNRKSSLSALWVVDPCGMSVSDPAKVQLPAGEYQVYARILAKPGKTKTGETRSVVFYPKLIDACNDNMTSPIVDFGDYIDCSSESLVGLGVVTSGGVFDKDSGYLTRIAPVRGSNKAQEMTDLFQWTGYACNELYDINADGQITLADLGGQDLNGDGLVNEVDLTLYLETYCSYYQSEWIFNIADLVVYGWDYYNSGSKLVQVRFYPKTTTTFE